MAGLHYLLSEFYGFLLSLLNNLPKFVRENISALVELFLRSIVFSEVRVFIGEVIEALDVVVKDRLLSIMSVEILKEVLGCGSNPDVSLLTLHADVSEDKLHLFLVILRKVLPKLDNDGFEVIVDVVSLSDNDRSSKR